MYALLMVLHVLCCVLLVCIVLLQVGRGRGVLGFIGGSTAETLFGGRAGDVLTKSTTVVAVVFMLTSLSLAYMSLKRTGSVTRYMKGMSAAVKEDANGVSIPAGENPIIRKGADIVTKAKNKLLSKIPGFGTEEKPVKNNVSSTTKSRIRYGKKGNKIEEQYKYDPSGKLTAHKEVTYDMRGKVIGEKDLPLTEDSKQHN